MTPPAVLMVGTGEYTTGFVGGGQSTSDKKIGVVALTMFDLRRRGKVSSLSMVGVSGKKFPQIRTHLQKNISETYNNLDVSFTSFPSDDTTDPDAYKAAIDALPKGSAVTIFTPDTTHYPIALYAIRRSHHVLITKPATKLLSEHLHLLSESEKYGVLVYIEHHKRFDPAYSDAKFRSRSMGDFNYFYSYMSQPKSQLATFAAWAGKESDISYYLNSHHIDICEWIVSEQGFVPTSVRASGSTGIAESLGCQPGTEDTITLLVDWVKKSSSNNTSTNKRATSIFTASWTAPQNAGVHSQQQFHYVASQGEISANQAQRGYSVVNDSYPEVDPASKGGVKWINPFYMVYAPDENGDFNGQGGYGYVSFEKFIDYATRVNEGSLTVGHVDRRQLPTLRNTVLTTAILEAGRRSLDDGGREVKILVDENDGAKVELK